MINKLLKMFLAGTILTAGGWSSGIYECTFGDSKYGGQWATDNSKWENDFFAIECTVDASVSIKKVCYKYLVSTTTYPELKLVHTGNDKTAKIRLILPSSVDVNGEKPVTISDCVPPNGVFDIDNSRNGLPTISRNLSDNDPNLDWYPWEVVIKNGVKLPEDCTSMFTGSTLTRCAILAAVDNATKITQMFRFCFYLKDILISSAFNPNFYLASAYNDSFVSYAGYYEGLKFNTTDSYPEGFTEKVTALDSTYHTGTVTVNDAPIAYETWLCDSANPGGGDEEVGEGYLKQLELLSGYSVWKLKDELSGDVNLLGNRSDRNVLETPGNTVVLATGGAVKYVQLTQKGKADNPAKEEKLEKGSDRAQHFGKRTEIIAANLSNVGLEAGDHPVNLRLRGNFKFTGDNSSFRETNQKDSSQYIHRTPNVKEDALSELLRKKASIAIPDLYVEARQSRLTFESERSLFQVPLGVKDSDVVIDGTFGGVTLSQPIYAIDSSVEINGDLHLKDGGTVYMMDESDFDE